MPKKPTAPLRTPDPGAFANLAPAEAGRLVAGQHLEGVRISGAMGTCRLLPSLRIESSLVESVSGAGARLQDLRLLDSVLCSSDFANSDWTGSSFRNCRIDRCRFTGWIASNSTFDHVCFVDCALDLSVLTEAVFRTVLFDGCLLTEASFEGSDLRRAQFKGCDLRNASFARAQMDGTDLRGSHLAGITARPQDLRGAIIEAAQAADLVHLLEVRVT